MIAVETGKIRGGRHRGVNVGGTASSLGNVYLSKQYTNMPDSKRKRSLLKQFQVCEQNYKMQYV